ncbi:MAG: hypothetical protein LUQ41_08765 [Methanomicrobiales archaeon]|nr:hypothetical protein [Methanomicrobiales archaeon]
MQNVGYIVREKILALDDTGHEECILALRLHGERYGIRVREVQGLLGEGVPARVERIRRNWRIFLDGVEGTAALSQSGKAVNLEFLTGARYTVARKSLQALLSGDTTYAMIAEIPGGAQPLVPLRRPPFSYQQRFPFTAPATG